MAVLVQSSESTVQRRTVDWDFFALVGVLAIILMIYVSNLNYNTAFVDEAIYIGNGQQALQGTSGFSAVRYMFGSYLYPVLAALAGYLFGQELIGARVLSAISITIAALAVYVLSRRLYGSLAGLAALVLFGFAANTQYVGQLATYDSLGIGLLAVAAALLVLGLTDTGPDRQEKLVFYAGVAFALSVLAKYIALLFVPALVVLLLGLLRQGDRQRVRLLQTFAAPGVLILVGYGVLFFDDLLRFVFEAGAYSSQPASQLVIVQTLINQWPYLALAIAGAVFVRASGNSSLATGTLFVAALTLPLYHIAAGNIRSLDKHIVYSLVFLLPLAGAAFAHTLTWLTGRGTAPQRSKAVQGLGVFTLVLVCFAFNYQSRQQLQQAWPNKRASIAFLATQPMPEGTTILAEGGETYALALDWNTNVTLTKTWDTGYSYKATTGDDALLAAVDDHVFDYIILDNYYTPDVSFRLEEAAIRAGYAIVHTDQQVISGSSNIITAVYASPTSNVEGGDAGH